MKATHRTIARIIFLLFLFVGIFSGNVHAFQDLPSRLFDYKQHRKGKMWSTVTNFGSLGAGPTLGYAAEYPGSDDFKIRYINRGGLLFGGIVEADGIGRNPIGSQDTLVTEGRRMRLNTDRNEMFPHFSDSRSLIRVRSTFSSSPDFHPDAVSDEDFIAVYTDTFTTANGASFAPTKHARPLGLEVTEKSYWFNSPLYEDMIFFDVEVKNIGNLTIKQFYIGVHANNDSRRVDLTGFSSDDDATGFLSANNRGETVNIAWAAEPDGDQGYVPGFVGIKILSASSARLSYNWWMSDNNDVNSEINDWGPLSPDVVSGIVDPNEQLGTPEEDEDKYVLMVNGSIDPDQADPNTGIFNSDIPAGADGFDNSLFLISAGPLGTPTGNQYSTIRGSEPETEFKPGETIRFVYAIIGGEGSSEISKNLGTPDPAALVDLGNNAAIAQQFYDSGFKSTTTASTLDSLALIALYERLDGPNWTNNTNWLSFEPMNTWYGVEVDGSGRVTGLDLANNNLKGALSSDIGFLTGLTSLSLQNNNITGIIPEKLDRLNNLTNISLQDNQISGALPSGVGTFPNLSILHLHNNNFTDLPVFTTANENISVSVQNNRLTFADIEPNIGKFGDFVYAPQDSVGERDSKVIEKFAGANTSLKAPDEIGASSNVYQWFKDRIEIVGGTEKNLTIINANESNSGAYSMRITNTAAPDLTLYTKPTEITVSVTTALFDLNLLLLDDNNFGENINRQEFRDLFLAAGFPVDTYWDVGGDHAASETDGWGTSIFGTDTLGRYKTVVIWTDASPVSAGYQAILSSYVQAGGNILLTSYSLEDFTLNNDKNPTTGFMRETAKVTELLNSSAGNFAGVDADWVRDITWAPNIDVSLAGTSWRTSSRGAAWALRSVNAPNVFTVVRSTDSEINQDNLPRAVFVKGEGLEGNVLTIGHSFRRLQKTDPDPVAFIRAAMKLVTNGRLNIVVDSEIDVSNDIVITDDNATVSVTFSDSSTLNIGFTSGAVSGQTVKVTKLSSVSDETVFNQQFTRTAGLYEISLDVSDFSADLTFGYRDAVLSSVSIAEDDLGVAFFASIDARGPIWHSVPVTLDKVNNTISVNTSHFSLWALVDKNDALITAVEEDENPNIPLRFELQQNYPNPFNPVTTIKYQLPAISDVKLEIFNSLGQLIKTVVDHKQAPGFYSVTWDGTNSLGLPVSSGIYIYRLRTGGFVSMKKMIFLR